VDDGLRGSARKKLTEAARVCMQGSPDTQTQAAALAAMGLRLEQAESCAAFELLPCVQTAVAVFRAVMTQWRCGASGAIGLDYPAVALVMERVFAITAEAFADVFQDLQVMEQGALAWLDEQRPPTPKP
jgi:Phage related hypothetical protein (DUF1799)